MAADENTQKLIENQRFDAPLIFKGKVQKEPERYIAEKPYDLTRYEFSVIRRRSSSEFWFRTISGATGGLCLAVIGKTIYALATQQSLKIDAWELCAIGVGILTSILFRFCIKSKEDKERSQLDSVIEGHFKENKPRKLHLTKGDSEK